jgi:hypothetical protein
MPKTPLLMVSFKAHPKTNAREVTKTVLRPLSTAESSSCEEWLELAGIKSNLRKRIHPRQGPGGGGGGPQVEGRCHPRHEAHDEYAVQELYHEDEAVITVLKNRLRSESDEQNYP